MNKLYKLFKISALSSAIILLSACSHTPLSQKYQHYSAQALYSLGHQAMQNKNCHKALETYNLLLSEYPFSIYSQKAALGSIYCNYKQGEPAIALGEAERYIKLYPTNSTAAYAYYMTGVIDFNNGRGFIQRHLPYNMSEHNAQSYRVAYRNFNTVVTQFPKSPYAHDAYQRMLYLRNTLAQYQINTANFYFKRGAYLAAVHRAQAVIKNYPHSPEVKSALDLLIQSYEKLKLFSLSQKIKSVYSKNYS